MTTPQDRPPVDPEWLYTLIWLLFCAVGTGAIAGLIASLPADWLIAASDAIDHLIYTVRNLYE